SFRLKFEQGLKTRGIEVSHDLTANSDAILVIAGTRFLPDLWRARRRGIRVVQRLDGINWVQRVRWTGARYHLRAEYGNAMLALIRGRFADRVIYQSKFIRKWWDDWYGVAKAPASVIINGVDLNSYSPNGTDERPQDRYRMLLLEGSLAGGLNAGLFHGVAVAEKLSEKFPMEVVVAGNVDDATQRKLQSKVPVKFLGTIPREQIPQLARSAHLMYCAEVNPPCPNSVIEALACGLPVIGFDSGSLKELVTEDAGRVVSYGANPWKLETPDIAALAVSAQAVLTKQEQFRRSVRRRAEAEFGLDKMLDSYLKVLLED
ncbi:MAG: glycosyltransferase family 4 protein, partial [Anaerolineales bacterium]|nr:glycosyltransferase family 4 protein [Anaerolineales bacterium]